MYLHDIVDNEWTRVGNSAEEIEGNFGRLGVSKWVYQKPVEPNLSKRGAANIVHEAPAPIGIARNAKTEMDTFLLFLTRWW